MAKKKKPDLAAFQVKSAATVTDPMPVVQDAPSAKGELIYDRAERERTLKRKTFELHPDAIREFEILRAARGLKSYEQMAEALNLLFEKYDRPQVA